MWFFLLLFFQFHRRRRLLSLLSSLFFACLLVKHFSLIHHLICIHIYLSVCLTHSFSLTLYSYKWLSGLSEYLPLYLVYLFFIFGIDENVHGPMRFAGHHVSLYMYVCVCEWMCACFCCCCWMFVCMIVCMRERVKSVFGVYAVSISVLFISRLIRSPVIFRFSVFQELYIVHIVWCVLNVLKSLFSVCTHYSVSYYYSSSSIGNRIRRLLVVFFSLLFSRCCFRLLIARLFFFLCVFFCA